MYERVLAEIPELVEEVHKRGLAMKMLFRAPGKEGKGNEFNWAGEHSFGKELLPGDDEETKRKKVEKQVLRLTSDFKWLDDEGLELTQHIPGSNLQYTSIKGYTNIIRYSKAAFKRETSLVQWTCRSTRNDERYWSS